jgi:hypothetical protein
MTDLKRPLILTQVPAGARTPLPAKPPTDARSPALPVLEVGLPSMGSQPAASTPHAAPAGNPLLPPVTLPVLPRNPRVITKEISTVDIELYKLKEPISDTINELNILQEEMKGNAKRFQKASEDDFKNYIKTIIRSPASEKLTKDERRLQELSTKVSNISGTMNDVENKILADVNKKIQENTRTYYHKLSEIEKNQDNDSRLQKAWDTYRNMEGGGPKRAEARRHYNDLKDRYLKQRAEVRELWGKIEEDLEIQKEQILSKSPEYQNLIKQLASAQGILNSHIEGLRAQKMPVFMAKHQPALAEKNKEPAAQAAVLEEKLQALNKQHTQLEQKMARLQQEYADSQQLNRNGSVPVLPIGDSKRTIPVSGGSGAQFPMLRVRER